MPRPPAATPKMDEDEKRNSCARSFRSRVRERMKRPGCKAAALRRTTSFARLPLISSDPWIFASAAIQTFASPRRVRLLKPLLTALTKRRQTFASSRTRGLELAVAYRQRDVARALRDNRVTGHESIFPYPCRAQDRHTVGLEVLNPGLNVESHPAGSFHVVNEGSIR